MTPLPFLSRLISSLAVATGSLFIAAAVQAQAWPARPVMIVVAYPPGGDTDAVARLYAEKLTARLGQQVLIENRPGASGTIGNAAVAKAAPDGYTLLFTPSTFPIAQHVLKLSPATAHDVVNDFTPIIKTGNIPLLMVTSSASGVKDIRQFITDAKGGKTETYGTPGSGSPMHIVGEMLNREAGVKIMHVPYRGVAPVVTDTLGGHVTVGWITPGAVGQHIQAGKLVPLAVAERQRTKLLPNVPTLIELGYRDLEVSAWMGLLGPKGLPPEIVRTLGNHMNEILKMPDVMTRMAALGIEPVGGDPSVLTRQITSDDERFGKLIKEFGIKAE